MTDWANYAEPGDGPLRLIKEQMLLADARTVSEAMLDDQWVFDGVLEPVLAVDNTGKPINRVCWVELARGHWKTGALATVALAEAVCESSTEVLVTAVDTEQAGLLLDSARGFLSRNPALASSFDVSKNVISVPQNGSRIRIISSDVASSWGVGGTHRRLRVYCDELTAWPERSRELFDSLTSATVKVTDAQIVVITNAGTAPGRSWQWKVREWAEREGHLYAPVGIIASWIDLDEVERLRDSMPSVRWERIFQNRWVSESGDFVSAEQLEAVVDRTLSPMSKGESAWRYYGGCDVGLVRDSTAIAVIGEKHGEPLRLCSLQVITGSRGAPVSIETVENAILDTAVRFPALTVSCDPWQFKGSVARLKRSLTVTEYVMTAQSVVRLSMALFTAITSKTVQIYPDADLEFELLNLETRETSAGWRVDHRPGQHNDRTTALALAILAATEHPSASLAGSIHFGPTTQRPP